MFVPNQSGCYVLANFEKEILYVGLSNNLRQRMGQHFNDPRKTSFTEHGFVFFYYWFKCKNKEQVERTWMNQCIFCDGELPILNSKYSPIST